MQSDTSSQDQQGQIGNQAEYKEQQLEQPKIGVGDDVKCFSGNGEPSILHSVDKTGGKTDKQGAIDEDGPVDDGAPLKKKVVSISMFMAITGVRF